jgi:AraC family transcriptional regulator
MLITQHPNIIFSEIKMIVGKRIQTTLMANETAKIWQSFMPFRNTITNKNNELLFSVEIYQDNFLDFTPESTFEKWAGVEVTKMDCLPEGMETCIIPAGMYAVFNYKGTGADAPETYRYFFETWIPMSNYILDNRPHFEAMGDKYIRNHPESEEELWIPIKEK